MLDGDFSNFYGYPEDVVRRSASMKPTSEHLFESYLRSLPQEWDYEPGFGSKHPDYLLHHSRGCVIEVEELQNPDPLPKVGFSPVPAIRDALRRARNQLRGCKHLPTAIVLYSESFYRSVSPITVAAAAFGPGYQDSHDHRFVHREPPVLRFLKPRELPAHLAELADPFMSAAANRSISAVIVLMHYRLSDFQLAMWQRLYARQIAGEQLPPGESSAVAAELQGIVPQTYRFEGTLRTVVIDNPHARIPFPQDLFCGPFDQRWTWRENECTPSHVGDTAAELYNSGVPFHLI